MDDKTAGRSSRTSLDGWSIATALGLMAAGFLINRVAPTDQKDKPALAKDLPQSDTNRDAPAASLATEGGDRGRQASSPSEIPARGWKDILYRVYANVGDHRILALAAT